MITNRKPIFTGDTVKLISEDARTAEFEIIDVIGGSADCMLLSAEHINTGKRGRLREFYPVDTAGEPVFQAKRLAEGDLVFTGDTDSAKLPAAQDAFKRSYLELNASFPNGAKGGSLIVPDYTVYYACDDRTGGRLGAGSVYIWSEDPDCEILDKYFARLREEAKTAPEGSLYKILSTFADLADAVRQLHEKGIFRPDITAYNFGVTKTGGICFLEADGDSDVTAFTRIAAPEAEFGRADFRSDIYSLGCLLYGALFPGKPYRWPHYGRIPSMVYSSPLITATDATANVYLRRELAEILQKCVELTPSLRYESCEELAGRVRALLEARFDPQDLDKTKADASGVIVRHLITHPLYENAVLKGADNNSQSSASNARVGTRAADSALNILVLGFGTYAQKFADIALSAGQMDPYSLNMLVLTEDPERDRAIYLETRPAFGNFFALDGSSLAEPYGRVGFRKLFIDAGSAEGLKNTRAALKDAFAEFAPSYVFIALGDDALSRRAATLCGETAKRAGLDVSVNFVRSRRDRIRSGGNPVYVNEIPDPDDPSERELQRLTANCELLRSGEGAERERAPVTIADVLSIKYKLHLLGIDIDADPAVQSAEFRVLSPESQNSALNTQNSILDMLIHSEHRRRVAELCLAGWRQSTDLERCAYKGISDKERRYHAALVRSRPGRGLTGPFANREYWDTADKAALDTLDDLDRLSVNLHRQFRAAAQAFILGGDAEKLLSGQAMDNIRSACMGSPANEKAFNDWFSCLKLLTGEAPVAVNYRAALNALQGAVAALPDAEEIRAKIDEIDSEFYPARAGVEYEDLKERDAFYIRHIPFILTYRSDLTLAVPVSFEDVFSNIRSAAVIDPENIVYLCYIDSRKGVETLLTYMRNICNFMESKGIGAKIRILIAYAEGLTDEVKPLLVSLPEISRGRITKVSVSEALGDADAAETVGRLLARTGLKIDLVEKNDTKLSYLLTGSGFYSGYPNFSFDPSRDRFTNLCGCGYLDYIVAGRRRLNVDDIVSVNGSLTAGKSDPELQFDYKGLWEFFSRDANARFWKKTCEHLENYTKEHDTFVTFKLDLKPEAMQPATFSCILENTYCEGIAKALRGLEEIGSIVTFFNITSYSSDSSEVTVGTYNKHIPSMRSMFQEIDRFATADRIKVARLNTEVAVQYAGLEVRDLSFGTPENFVIGIGSVLGFLQDRRLIAPLSGSAVFTKVGEGQNTKYIYNFKYATRQIRDLMLSSGKILEVWVYHKCLESGRFDDITSGQVIRWDGDGIENEFDCIITKGLRTLFVECKATYTIRQEYYYKLAALTSRFGPNARAVLIADTRESSEDSTNGQTIAMQIKRGNKLGVYTVTDKKDIDNIDVILEKIIDGEVEC